MPSLLGFAALAAAVAWAGYRAGALTAGGARAAALVGAVVLAGTSWAGGLLLGLFFVSSSGLSRWAERRAPSPLDLKGTRRDAAQVMANGGAAMAGGVLALAAPELGLWVLAAALSAAAADTWATSLGAFSRGEPRHLLTGLRVPRGTSGAVSWVGSLGAGGAAALMGAAATALAGPALGGAAFGLGVAGMLVDSVLGATLQGRFRCPACAAASEHRRHRCGAATERVGGLAWLDNDGVNFASTALAGAGGALLWWLCSS